MPRNTSVTIGSHLKFFISGQLEEGPYGSASKVDSRAGLRLLEDHETETTFGLMHPKTLTGYHVTD